MKTKLIRSLIGGALMSISMAWMAKSYYDLGYSKGVMDTEFAHIMKQNEMIFGKATDK